MPYVHFTREPGVSLSVYDAVSSALGSAAPAGLLAHWAGVQDGALCTVDVWQTRADADRFAAEQLFPAFEQVGHHPSADTTIVAFEAEETVDA